MNLIGYFKMHLTWRILCDEAHQPSVLSNENISIVIFDNRLIWFPYSNGIICWNEPLNEKKKWFDGFFEWKIIDCYMFFCINMDQAVYFWMRYMLICTFKFIWSNSSLISSQYFNWIGFFLYLFSVGKGEFYNTVIYSGSFWHLMNSKNRK